MQTVTVPEDQVGAQAAARRFRRVLGRVPTGVALITATTPAGPVGMAV